MGKKEALRLLFAPGFSTRKQVSEISGRGVGLDVVATIVNRVGGEVFVETEPRQGTTFILEVPVARRGESVMLLRVGQLRIALPAAVVRRATRIDPGAVVERDGRTLVTLADDRLVPFVPLARLYGQPAADSQLLLEGVVSGQPLALAVDTVEGEQEVLVRPITRRAPTDRLLEGVALLASGEPVGVLSPSMLSQREYLRALPAARPQVVIRRVRVLLVDDSLVTREMERRLLEDAGFEVVGGRRRRGGAVAARRGAASTAWSPTSRCRAWTASSSPPTCAPWSTSPTCRSSSSRRATARRTACAASRWAPTPT